MYHRVLRKFTYVLEEMSARLHCVMSQKTLTFAFVSFDQMAVPVPKIMDSNDTYSTRPIKARMEFLEQQLEHK
jgi:hypothetical protein